MQEAGTVVKDAAALDHTHDAAARSWIGSADGHPDFPLQNLPLGVFAIAGGESSRPGVAIGDAVLDLAAIAEADLLPGATRDAMLASDLCGFFRLSPADRLALRHRLFEILSAGYRQRGLVEPHLHPAADVRMKLPARPGGYTDFYAGIVHATNVGRLLRPDSPLMPNYKHLPIAYHGRTSSIVVSGTPVRRPCGQLKSPDQPLPDFGPTSRLDYETELGFWIAGGNPQGTPVPISAARDRIAGVTLLNDWSARDVQAWEYQPLGPFLAKNFATTVSPWLVTAEALAPFRMIQPPRPAGDPPVPEYLDDDGDRRHGAFDIGITVAIRTAAMLREGRDPVTIGRTGAKHLYWTPSQMIAHHASGGCPLEPGDLLGTGTISAPDEDGFGSLMEITRNGAFPLRLPNGEERKFLEDGDEIVFIGKCARDGYATIGFGECRGTVLRTAIAS